MKKFLVILTVLFCWVKAQGAGTNQLPMVGPYTINVASSGPITILINPSFATGGQYYNNLIMETGTGVSISGNNWAITDKNNIDGGMMGYTRQGDKYQTSFTYDNDIVQINITSFPAPYLVTSGGMTCVFTYYLCNGSLEDQYFTNLTNYGINNSLALLTQIQSYFQQSIQNNSAYAGTQIGPVTLTGSSAAVSYLLTWPYKYWTLTAFPDPATVWAMEVDGSVLFTTGYSPILTLSGTTSSATTWNSGTKG